MTHILSVVVVVSLFGLVAWLVHLLLCPKLLVAPDIIEFEAPDLSFLDDLDVSQMVNSATQAWERGALVGETVESHKLIIWEVAEDGEVLLSKGDAALSAVGLRADQTVGSNIFRDWDDGSGALDAVRYAFSHSIPCEWWGPGQFPPGVYWWNRSVLINRDGRRIVRIVSHTISPDMGVHRGH